MSEAGLPYARSNITGYEGEEMDHHVPAWDRSDSAEMTVTLVYDLCDQQEGDQDITVDKFQIN